jgi:hypothetical protein
MPPLSWAIRMIGIPPNAWVPTVRAPICCWELWRTWALTITMSNVTLLGDLCAFKLCGHGHLRVRKESESACTGGVSLRLRVSKKGHAGLAAIGPARGSVVTSDRQALASPSEHGLSRRPPPTRPPRPTGRRHPGPMPRSSGQRGGVPAGPARGTYGVEETGEPA